MQQSPLKERRVEGKENMNYTKNKKSLLVQWLDGSLLSHHSFQELFAPKFSWDLQRN